MVVVSHDRHLLELIADRIILVDGGTASELDGSLDDYRATVLGPNAGNGKKGEKQAKRGNRKDERREAAAARERLKDMRKEADKAEAALKQLWKRRAEIDALLAAPQANGTSASDLMKTRGEIERNIGAAEQRWLKASEAAEGGASAGQIQD